MTVSQIHHSIGYFLMLCYFFVYVIKKSEPKKINLVIKERKNSKSIEKITNELTRNQWLNDNSVEGGIIVATSIRYFPGKSFNEYVSWLHQKN